MMLTLISLSLYDLSQHDFTLHAPYTYVDVMHLTLCGRIFKCTIFEIVYNGKGTAKQNSFPHNSIRFALFLPISSPHTIHRVNFQESASLLENGSSNNMIFLFQKCDTFDRTAKGRAGLVGVTSQDHPDYTQLIWSSSIKIHFVD